MLWFNSQPQNDVDRGRLAMKYFHNQSSKYSGYSYGFDQMLDLVGGGDKKTTIFLDSLGYAISSIGMDDSKIEDAMEAFADQCQGKLPNSTTPFFQALSNRVENITFKDWILEGAPQVALDTAKDVGQGVVAVGDSVITTLSSLNTLFPLMVVGGIIYIFIHKVKKVAE